MHCTPRLGGMSTMRYIIAIVLLYTYNTNWIVRAYNNNRLEKTANTNKGTGLGGVQIRKRLVGMIS